MERRLLFEHIDVPGIETYDVYRSKGGYASVEKALKTMAPDAVVEEGRALGPASVDVAPVTLKDIFLETVAAED